MNFGEALRLLQDGKRVARSGWNGKGMFAYLVPAASYPVQTGAAKAHFGEGSMVPYRAYLALKTADDDVATWAPSCSDVLADDWAEISDGQAVEQPKGDFLSRLKDEREDLDRRLGALNSYLTHNPGRPNPRHNAMLQTQAGLMSELLAVIDERLADIAISDRSAPVEKIDAE